jgi:hypothetical protein
MRLSERVIHADQPVRVRVARRGAGGQTFAPVVRVWRNGELAAEVSPGAVPGQSEEWEAIFSVGLPGAHRIELVAGEAVKPAVYETLLVKAPPAEEEDLSADPEWLEELASATGGRVLDEARLAGWLGPAPESEELSTQENARWVSRWDRGPWLVLVAALFAAEWILRRRSGLT